MMCAVWSARVYGDAMMRVMAGVWSFIACAASETCIRPSVRERRVLDPGVRARGAVHHIEFGLAVTHQDHCGGFRGGSSQPLVGGVRCHIGVRHIDHGVAVSTVRALGQIPKQQIEPPLAVQAGSATARQANP